MALEHVVVLAVLGGEDGRRQPRCRLASVHLGRTVGLTAVDFVGAVGAVGLAVARPRLEDARPVLVVASKVPLFALAVGLGAVALVTPVVAVPDEKGTERLQSLEDMNLLQHRITF